MARASKYEDKRDLILADIVTAAASHAKPPSVRDLAAKHEVGVATMHSYLSKLASEGAIEWKPGRHRSLKPSLQDSQLPS